MSIECGECEHDLRGGHGTSCSRYKSEDEEAVREKWPEVAFVDDGTCFRLWSHHLYKDPTTMATKVSGRHKTKERCWADAARHTKNGTRPR